MSILAFLICLIVYLSHVYRKCPTHINAFKQVSIQVHHKYHSQYQSQYCSACNLGCLSYMIEINQELKVHTNTLLNINPDTTQPVFST